MSLTADVLDIKSRILQYNADIKAALEGLGLTVPEGTQTKDFSTLIGQVSTSGDPIPLPMVFEIPTRADNLAMHFALETFEASDYSGTAVEVYDTTLAQTNVLATDGTEWETFPSTGVGPSYYSKGLAVILQTGSETVTKFFVRYKFYIAGEDPTAEPWRFTICDIVGNNTINILAGTSSVVSSTEPASPAEGMIWVEPIVG